MSSVVFGEADAFAAKARDSCSSLKVICDVTATKARLKVVIIASRSSARLRCQLGGTAVAYEPASNLSVSLVFWVTPSQARGDAGILDAVLAIRKAPMPTSSGVMHDLQSQLSGCKGKVSQQWKCHLGHVHPLAMCTFCYAR